MRPVVPTSCPYRGTGEDVPCRVGIHHWRDRKEGPGHPLGVAACRAHGRAFTLYPPGWTPYGRAPLAPARADGEPVSPMPLDRWRATRFAAALDAVADRLWPRGGAYAGSGRWATQCRQLAALAGLVGVVGGGGVDHQHAVAQVLGLPTQVVLDAAAAVPAAGSRGRTRAVAASILAVVEALPGHRDAFLPLARVGHAVGLWGRVFRVQGARCRHVQQLHWLRVNDFDP